MKKRIFCAICTFLVITAAGILNCFASVDWTSYTSSNLLPLPYTSGTPGSVLTTNGVTWTINEDASITFTGTSTADVFFWLANIPLESGQYNYHSEVTGTSTGLWVGWDTNNGNVYDSEGTFYASSTNPYRFYLALQPNKAYNFTIKVMLNRTATAYPYQPYIPYYIQEAKTSPDTWNAFNYSTCTAQIRNDGGMQGNWYQNHNFDPQLILGGIQFANLYNWVESNVLDDEFNSITINITFDDNALLPYFDVPLFYTYNTQAFSAGIFQFETDTGIIYTVLPELEGDHYNLQITDTIQSYPVLIKKVTFTLTEWTSLNQTTIYTQSYAYSNGYGNGYNEGIKANNQTIYETGKTDGYKNGYIEGKADGLSMSDSGDWRSLISAVIEAPVNVFQDLFSFEILGMDMRAAVEAVLAICVILIIIKKVIL